MSCSICGLAGHDEALHGEEGHELLRLRELQFAVHEFIKRHSELQMSGRVFRNANKRHVERLAMALDESRGEPCPPSRPCEGECVHE